MMNASRLELHEDLCGILQTRYVYFQPPESIKMKYPAIVYSRSDVLNKYAADSIYDQTVTYKVTIIDHDPDSEVVERMLAFKYATFDRHYTANGLNHDQFIVNFKK